MSKQLAEGGEPRVRSSLLSAASLADPLLALQQTPGGGEVEVLSGFEDEEVSDELLVAHGEADLAAELTPGAPPSPLPVREGAA